MLWIKYKFNALIKLACVIKTSGKDAILLEYAYTIIYVNIIFNFGEAFYLQPPPPLC